MMIMMVVIIVIGSDGGYDCSVLNLSQLRQRNEQFFHAFSKYKAITT